MTKTYESAAILLLRRLAGRLADSTLESLWSYLGAGELVMLEDTLFGALELEDVALTQDEVRTLRDMLDDPNDARLNDVTVLSTEQPEQRYRFTAGTENGANEAAVTETDRVVIGEVSKLPSVRRVLRARRHPAGSGPAGQGTWVYLVQVAAGTYVPHVLPGISSALLLSDAGTYPVEVVAEGEELPPYQSAALTTGRQIWPPDPGERP
ncbi:hypothetical protein [Gandjariella thermophila]|uniref:Uncharacterized protein n=1 Tax=Gandjariella thermophila TaxID=1931992 RepID=A0A4D4JGU7_9PSEU|nr:hypothetical protein [Gandjariella thermophila]GDY33529.1 hypothetical protein GTS_51620 [Gandjariella thermophila]